jgi:hypothetical protein
LIIEHIVVENNFAVNHVFPLAHPVRDQHPDYMWLSTSDSLLNLAITKVIAEAIVFCSLVFLSTLLDP